MLENVRLEIIRRLNNSVNGNPRFRVYLHALDYSTTTHDTSSDAACSYDVENVAHSGELIDVSLTRAGLISTITRKA